MQLMRTFEKAHGLSSCGWTTIRLWQSSNWSLFLATNIPRKSQTTAHILLPISRCSSTLGGPGTVPTPPNSFGAQVLRFYPTSDYLIWMGEWWLSKAQLSCGSTIYARRRPPVGLYRRLYSMRNCVLSPLTHRSTSTRRKLSASIGRRRKVPRIIPWSWFSVRILIVGRINPFDSVSGLRSFQSIWESMDVGYRLLISFTFLIPSVDDPGKWSLELQVSLDGKHFALGQFPPRMRLDTHVRYFPLLLLPINNYFDRPIMYQNCQNAQ